MNSGLLDGFGIPLSLPLNFQTGSSITTSTTLSATQPIAYPVAMTSLGQSVTAPNATYLNVGLFAVLDNTNGSYPVGFRDSTGALVGKYCIGAGGIGFVYLDDNSSSSGTWRIIGTNLEPGIVAQDFTFSSTFASTVLAPSVSLDNNTSIHFCALSSGFAAFVVDKNSTTPTT